MFGLFMHHIFEFTEGLCQECGQKLGSERSLWDPSGCDPHALVFPDWKTLLSRVHMAWDLGSACPLERAFRARLWISSLTN